MPTTGFHAGIGAPGRPHHELDDLVESLGVDVEVEALDVLERHDDLFERRVARTLAEAADGDVDPGRAGVDARDRVGHGHAEVVVRVHLDLEAGLLDEPLDDLVRPERLHDADGVAEAQPVGALGLGGRRVLEQEAELGAAGVLGVDRDVDAFALRVRDALTDRVR